MGGRVVALMIAVAALVPGVGRAVIPEAVPDLPVAVAQAPRGTGLITHSTGLVTPTAKVVDGNIDDWTGGISRYAGTAIYSHGEYVYQDYIADNWGADDGQDTQRTQVTDALIAAEPRAHSVEALAQVEGEQDPVGIGCPEGVPTAGFCAPGNYGDAGDRNARAETDIEEVRVAADDDTLYVLVRTAEMLAPDKTGVVVIFGSGRGDKAAPGGITTASTTWLLAGGNAVLQSSNINDAAVASNADGYTNAVEISMPLDPAQTTPLALQVATCVIEGNDCKQVHPGDAKSDLLNVAFRPAEPARIWMDRLQAVALYHGDISEFTATIDVPRLRSGYTESFEPRPGYWERIYTTDSPVNNEAQESGSYFQGTFQHYGVYLPSNFRVGGGPYPTTWWTHYRGGHAHDAAAWVPGLLRQFGEQKGNIVITPSARGTSSWYVGRGMEDFLNVWDDSMASLPIDPDRVYMTGYSMGGFASWLLPTLMPDRFAGASPQEGPPTQGMFVAPGIVTGGQNGGDVEAQNTYNILENARGVPYVTYHGTDDELVPITGIEAMHAKLISLGYRNRLYRLDGNEHYTTAIVDSWTEAAEYLNQLRRDLNPAHVTYRTWPAIEHAVSTISTLPGQDLHYRFNKAYWVSGLEVRDVNLLPDGKPDPQSWGTIDATTLGRGDTDHLLVPEAGVGQQGTPYEMTGLKWISNGHVPAANRFTATLQNLRDATLDLARMGISIGGDANPIRATVTTDGPTRLHLRGAWPLGARITGGGTATLDGDVLTITLPEGTFNLAIA